MDMHGHPLDECLVEECAGQRDCTDQKRKSQHLRRDDAGQPEHRDLDQAGGNGDDRIGREAQLTRCFCEDERRDLTLLRPYGPARVVVTWIMGATLPLAGKAGVALISDVPLVVSATHTARPEDWRRTHSRRRRRSGSRWLHRVAMSLMLRGHSDGSRQSEDGKTDKRGFGHSQLP